MKRYQILARWWNGHDWDEVYKEAETKKQLKGAFNLLIDEVRLYHISIIDTTQKREKEWGAMK